VISQDVPRISPRLRTELEAARQSTGARVLQLNESETPNQPHEDTRIGTTAFLGTIVCY
jgi:hypothetical protein